MEPQIKRIDPEFPLPEPIIQHIQSFLSGKEAAQTTILSKSWYTAWLTRPDLYFNQCDFECSSGNRGDEKGFWEFVQKTMQRYEELNLKIESLRLLMRGESLRLLMRGGYNENGVEPNNSRAKELIVKAMKMGVVDLYFDPLYEYHVFAFPHEVLGSETLTRLSMVGCKIGDGKVKCSKLKSLSLRGVYLEGDIIWDIISSCPLIEKLSLSACRFLLESQNSDVVSSPIELSPFTVFGKRNVGSIGHGQIKLFVFHKLKCLSLSEVVIHPLFFRDFSSRFPCLKELTLTGCIGWGYEGIRISSRSLECITFSQEQLKVNLDVPSIRKFKFQGRGLPSLAFETFSTNWESDISLICHRPNTLWVLNLKKLLTSLSPSRISLSLTIWSVLKQNIDFQGLPKIALENLAIESLTMDATFSACYTLLECLFQNSCPKFVTLYVPPLKEGNANNGFLLPTRLVQRLYENGSSSYQEMFGLDKLEEVYVKLFEEVLAGWQPLALSTLLDASTILGNKQKICFQLTW